MKPGAIEQQSVSFHVIFAYNSTFYAGQVLMFLSALLGNSSSHMLFEEIVPSYACHQLIAYTRFMLSAGNGMVIGYIQVQEKLTVK